VNTAVLPHRPDIIIALTRRRVLRGGALVLSASIMPDPGFATPVPTAESTALTAGVRVGRDGAVTVLVSQSEMGQGISTSLAAAIADELYLPVDKVGIEFAPFTPAYRHPVYQWMFTGNSEGISAFHPLARKMGAAAREMLTAAAAARWGTAADGISLNSGRIIHPDGRLTLGFGGVAADAAQLPVPENPKLREKPPSAGRALPRWDIPAKVDGSAEFGIDLKLPQMLLAAVRRAPQFGASLDKFDADAIRSRPGVVSVVALPDGLIAVARTWWQARRALDDAALTWTTGDGSIGEGDHGFTSGAFDQLCAARMTAGPFFTHLQQGDAAPDGAVKIEATYQLPFQAHATMEPMNCTSPTGGARSGRRHRAWNWRRRWPPRSPACRRSGSRFIVRCSAAGSGDGSSPTSSSWRSSPPWR
jgi:isoquinoline 1-oxidoreductase beta subunit